MVKFRLDDGMCVIGMDPSSYKNCGWAVLQYMDGKVLLIDKFTQVFEFAPEIEDPWNSIKRFRETYDLLERTIKKYNAQFLCLERSIGGGLSFVRGNLSETVGIAKLCCYDNNCEIFETSPSHLKKQITGSGKAKKKHIKANVLGFFNLKSTGTEHECDAACCALSYFIDAGWLGYKITLEIKGKVKGKSTSNQNIKMKDMEIQNVTKPAN